MAVGQNIADDLLGLGVVLGYGVDGLWPKSFTAVPLETLPLIIVQTSNLDATGFDVAFLDEYGIFESYLEFFPKIFEPFSLKRYSIARACSRNDGF